MGSWSSSLEKDKHHFRQLQDVEHIHQQLLAYFEQEQPYLNPELSIQEIALALDVSVHALSQTINSQEQKTFYDLVNGYRVDHLKKLLSDLENARYTILGLAHDSGFNSKASLNRIFKNHTQQTPSEYRKAQTGV